MIFVELENQKADFKVEDLEFDFGRVELDILLRKPNGNTEKGVGFGHIYS